MYCFNTNCNRWGEHASSGGMLLWWPGDAKGVCDECGSTTVAHDNWDADERTHDDGTPVKDLEIEWVRPDIQDRYRLINVNR